MQLIYTSFTFQLSESDFKSSLAIAGFPEEKQEVLVRLHSTKKAELSEALQLLQQKDPTYQDFRWRFEIQVNNIFRRRVSKLIFSYFILPNLN